MILIQGSKKSFPMEEILNRINDLEEILNLINDLGAEVTSGVVTSDEAAQLLVYGNVVENS